MRRGREVRVQHADGLAVLLHVELKGLGRSACLQELRRPRRVSIFEMAARDSLLEQALVALGRRVLIVEDGVDGS